MKRWLALVLLACAFRRSSCQDSREAISPQEVHHRCRGTTGNWCPSFLSQAPVAWKAAEGGEKQCPNNCSSAGNCNADTGICDCPAGWKGSDCATRDPRPCTNRWRESPLIEEPTSSYSLSDAGWTASRCAGICDEDVAMCFCNGTQGRLPAPPGSPPGSPPLREGRPMILCAPNLDDLGNPSFGSTTPEELYKPGHGWCEAEKPQFRCSCKLDGLAGEFCELPTEQVCINQCSGHGVCHRGWCKCQEGYYGQDCAHLAKGFAGLADINKGRKGLEEHTANPAAEDPPPQPERLRPLIYIYDLPAIYNSRMMQYRPEKWQCSHRTFDAENRTEFSHQLYGLETALHEMLAQSPHRTLDPEEADFFYVPVYTSCYAWPIFGWADYPWFYGVNHLRVAHMSNMLLSAKRWLEKTLPFWSRRGGRDHIWLLSHDEGSCWVPEELRPSIILSHWGRKDENHTSGTAYKSDNYSEEWVVPELSPLPWNHILGKGVPCYDPKKDLVIPTHLSPVMLRSPLLGTVPFERNTLLFFRGAFRNDDEPGYSRGIRQKLHKLAQENDWKAKHGIVIGTPAEIPGDYSELLASSVFCVVAPGDGYSSRAEDSILNGCIPVVIMDEIDAIFESILDWSLFSVRVKQADIERLPEILGGYSVAEIRSMQVSLSHVWHRFAYLSQPMYQKVIQPVIQGNRELAVHSPHAPASLPGPQYGNLHQDDALATILAWLHSQIDAINQFNQTTI